MVYLVFLWVYFYGIYIKYTNLYGISLAARRCNAFSKMASHHCAEVYGGWNLANYSGSGVGEKLQKRKISHLVAMIAYW